MRALIINLVADDTWQEVALPNKTFEVTIQARTASDCLYRYRGVDAYMTIKAGGTVTINGGELNPGDLFVRAAVGVVIEIECITVVLRR